MHPFNFSGGRLEWPEKVPSGVCTACGRNPSTEPHICPFADEINGNRETLCTCCDECAQNCADDI